MWNTCIPQISGNIPVSFGLSHSHTKLTHTEFNITPGTIDADYRGEVGVILINHGEEDYTIERGMRIAQMVIARVRQLEWHEVSDLDETDRGEGGFGSTGTEG